MSLPHPNILIVEDDPDHLAIVQHYLAKCGDRVGEVQSVTDLGAATEVLERGGVDLVLIDLTLPSSSLEQTIEHIPNLQSFGASIVALSSLDSPEIEVRVRSAGGAGFLAKRVMSEKAIHSILDLEAGARANGDANGQHEQRDSTTLVEPAASESPSSAPKQAQPRQAQPKPTEPKPTEPKPTEPAPTGTGETRSGAAVTTSPGPDLGDDAIPLSPPDARPLDARDVASRLAHDVSSWLASVSFRISALEADPALDASEHGRDHLQAIKNGTRIVSDYVRASRALVLDETAEVELIEIDLPSWMQMGFATWAKATIHSDLTFDHSDLPTVLADDTGLQAVLTVLADNALAHHGDVDGSPILTMRGVEDEAEAGTSAGFVTIEVENANGIWDPKNVPLLGQPVAHGRADRAKAGLGLVRVGRWMHRMGGSAAVAPRRNAPGQHAVRLTFRAPEND